MSDDKANVKKELEKELETEPDLTVPPPQLTLQEEPIPNPNVEAMVNQQKKADK